jgi:hypothetical protein
MLEVSCDGLYSPLLILRLNIIYVIKFSKKKSYSLVQQRGIGLE